jgi:hypothetical protein
MLIVLIDLIILSALINTHYFDDSLSLTRIIRVLSIISSLPSAGIEPTSKP